MEIHMNTHRARLDRERRLWAESREREMQLVDDVLAPARELRITSANGTAFSCSVSMPGTTRPCSGSRS